MKEKLHSLVYDELLFVNKKLESISTDEKILNQGLKSFILGSSKRIRTLLASLYIKSFRNNVSEKSLEIISAGELIHDASLLHDDVIDNADTRRGESVIAKTFSPKVSILLGDYLLSSATEILLKIDNKEILSLFLECTQKMCNSEFKQYFLREKVPNLDEYLNICTGKTGTLFETILKSCAIAEGLDTQKAGDFGKNFGILFQLKNDLLETSAKADQLNKIFTPKDFLGIEKTAILIDNYSKHLENIISEMQKSQYTEGLGALIKT